MNDNELLDHLKLTAKKANISPEYLILLGEAAASYNAIAVIPNFGPYPMIEDAAIEAEQLDCWPEWVALMVPEGSRWERLLWPDGSVTIRLVNHQARVLGAIYFNAEESKGR